MRHSLLRNTALRNTAPKEPGPFRQILHESTRPLELFLSSLEVLWGAWLLLPFHAFTSGRIYPVMGGVAVETLWGLVLLTLGGVHILFLRRGWRRARLILMPLVVFFWWFIAFLSWVGAPSSPGALLTLWISFWVIWVIWRLGRTSP